MNTALILIDVQASFCHRAYWNASRAAPFLACTNRLVGACVAGGVPVLRILHSDGPAEAGNPFAIESGEVRPLDGLVPFEAAAEFIKHRHSALVGTGLLV